MTPAQAAAAATTPAVATAESQAAGTQTAAGTVNTSTTISTVGDLKQKAPQIWKATLEGIAMNIINNLKHHQDRVHKMWQESNRDPQG